MVKILGQIDLESLNRFKKPESKEDICEKLSHALESVSRSVNSELGSDFLHADASVNMDSFADQPGYGLDSVDRDKKFVDSQEENWSKETGLSRENWKKDKKMAKSTMLEMAITVVFHKLLKDKFLVMRTSSFDDYSHHDEYKGVDNIIINKETGDVVCAFDEVHDRSDNARAFNKIQKIKRAAKQGGATIKYGLAYSKEQGALVKSPVQHIPMFCLSLNPEELSGLLKGMDYNSENSSVSEKEAFSKLINSLKDQVDMLEAEEIGDDVRNNLSRFRGSLALMEASAATR